MWCHADHHVDRAAMWRRASDLPPVQHAAAVCAAREHVCLAERRLDLHRLGRRRELAAEQTRPPDSRRRGEKPRSQLKRQGLNKDPLGPHFSETV